MAKNKILIIVCVVIVAGVTVFAFTNSRQTSAPAEDVKDGGIPGADADGDGLWDYVQKYIDETYPNEPATRAALRQYALALQRAILSYKTKEESLAAHEILARARECLRYINGGDSAQAIRNDLKEKILNTRERSTAYYTYDRHLSGEFFTIPAYHRPTACDFDVDALMGKK